jgi:hypothetical protein
LGLGFSLVLGLIAVLGFYYVIHKPITTALAAALASTGANLGVAVWLTLIGGGVGRRMLGGGGGQGGEHVDGQGGEHVDGQGGEHVGSPLRVGEWVVVRVTLGWGVMGLGMLGLGLARLYYAPLLWGVALTATLLLWRDIRGWLWEAGLALRESRPADSLSRVAAAFGVMVLALGLLRALAPPLMWDALVYHLTLPKLYAQTRQIQISGDFFFSGLPQLNEMLYTAALLLRGEAAAQTLGWMFGAMLVLGLRAHASAMLGPRAGPLAVALLFSSFSIALSLAWAYGELLLMLMAVTMLVALRRWRLTGAPRWLWLAGVFAGLALGCKYTGAVVPLAGAAVVAASPLESNVSYVSQVRPHRAISLWAVARFLLAAGLTFSPWLLKNLLFTGNPIYPLFFAAPDVDALRLWFYNRPDLTERNPLWAALIFFRAVFLGVQGGNQYEATLNPLLAFLPLGLALGWKRLTPETRGELGPILTFTLAGYGTWIGLTFVSVYAAQARLFFVLFPALALLCVAGLSAMAGLDTSTLRASVIVNAALILILGLSAFELGVDFLRRNPLPYLLGEQTAAHYRGVQLGWHAIAVERVNALPPGSRVVFLWEARSLDCAAPDRCAPDVIIDRWWHLRRTVGEASAIAAYWKTEGFTHVLLYDAGAKFVQAEPTSAFTAADWAELEALRTQLRLMEDMGAVYSLYLIP